METPEHYKSNAKSRFTGSNCSAVKSEGGSPPGSSVEWITQSDALNHGQNKHLTYHNLERKIKKTMSQCQATRVEKLDSLRLKLEPPVFQPALAEEISGALSGVASPCGKMEGSEKNKSFSAQGLKQDNWSFQIRIGHRNQTDSPKTLSETQPEILICPLTAGSPHLPTSSFRWTRRPLHGHEWQRWVPMMWPALDPKSSAPITNLCQIPKHFQNKIQLMSLKWHSIRQEAPLSTMSKAMPRPTSRHFLIKLVTLSKLQEINPCLICSLGWSQTWSKNVFRSAAGQNSLKP